MCILIILNAKIVLSVIIGIYILKIMIAYNQMSINKNANV